MGVSPNPHQGMRESAELAAAREKLLLTAQLERDQLDNAAKVARQRESAGTQVDINRMIHEESQAHQQALTDLELKKVAAHSQAIVAERQAVQPALVEALTALGDKIMLGEVASNMNLVSLFKGKDVASIFADVVGGTKLGRTIAGQLPDKVDE